MLFFILTPTQFVADVHRWTIVVIFDYISRQHVDREQLQALTTIYLEY